ncbi:MAG: dockerin type I domain-containing protein [Aureliella sp.]
MKKNGRRRGGLKLEKLEARTVFAAVSGSVWIDLDGDSQFSAGDENVPSALVWVDANRNGQADAGEPQMRTDVDGQYAFTGLAVGDYEIRVQPTPGLFQTSPSQYFAMYRVASSNLWGLVKIDPETGSVTQGPAAPGVTMHGLIKTIHGEFYGTRADTDSLYRIDPETGAQQLIGATGKQLVAGLAYDPVGDKLYTLARDTDTDAPPLLLYEIDRQTGELTRVGTGEGIAGVRATSGVTFDWVNREVVLFDNALDQFVAYDLNGNARVLSKFSSGVGFYNLAFDGHRFLIFVSNDQSASLYEVDVNQATFTPLRTLDQAPWSEVGDILAAGEPQRVHLPSDAAEQTGLDFVTNRMNIPHGSLEIDGSTFHLTSPDKGLDIAAPADDAALPLRFCVGAQASDLTIHQSLDEAKPIQVQMSPLDDRVSIDAVPQIAIEMGAGRDTLVPTGPMELHLRELIKNLGRPVLSPAYVTGLDVIDLSGSDIVTLVVDYGSIANTTDAKKLTVIASDEDRVTWTEAPWAALKPTVDGDRRLHELSLRDVILELDNGLGWHNPINAVDVNRDGNVTPLDALLVVNLLNQAGSRTLTAADTTLAQAEYVDSNGDRFLSPIDALLVINEINSRT